MQLPDILPLSCSLAVLGPTAGHTTDALSPFISVILTDFSTESPVHVLMLSIQAVHGLPRLHAPGIVPCIVSFSRQLSCFPIAWTGPLAGQGAKILAIERPGKAFQYVQRRLLDRGLIYSDVHKPSKPRPRRDLGPSPHADL